jgi:hypothetical protein
VWERLVRYAGKPALAERQTERLPALAQERTLLLPVAPRGTNPSRRQKRQSSRPSQTRFGRRASLLVAILVMIMLVGSLVVVLHEIRPNVPTGTRSYTLGQTVYRMTRGSKDPLFVDLAWSPDRQRLAVLQLSHQGSDVQIWDATTGGNRVTIHVQNLIYCMTWSPNGRWIALAGLGTDIAIVDAQNGALVHQYSVGTVTIEGSGSLDIVNAQTGTLVHRFTYGTGMGLGYVYVSSGVSTAWRLFQLLR